MPTWGDPRLPQLLWSKISPCPMTGCWLWLAYVSGNGYGRYSMPRSTDGKQRVTYAHRVVYEALVQPVPAGLDLDHLCRVRPCCNPDHLEPVTRGENIMRGDGPVKTRARRDARTHCPAGHPYSGDNLYVDRNGWRMCKTCQRQGKLRDRGQAE